MEIVNKLMKRRGRRIEVKLEEERHTIDIKGQ